MKRPAVMGAVAFLTLFGRGQGPKARALWWFPVVGAGLGGLLAAIHWGAGELWPLMVVGLLVVAADLVLIEGVSGAVAAGVAVAVSIGVVALAWRRLGGFTGDVLGTVILMAETTALLALVADP